MASMITKPQRHKQLGELLQQKQEPFVLDLYLFERGYLKKSLSSNLDSTTTSFGRPNKLSTKRIIPSCSRILRVLLNKFARKNDTKSSSGHRRNSGEEEVAAERNRFSSASSTTVFNMCSESDKDESSSPTSSNKYYDSVIIADTLEGLRHSNNMTEEEACADREFQCHVMANINKQLSPVSVLEQIPQSKLRSRESETTTCTVRLPNKLVVVDSTTLSASLCQLRSHDESDSDESIRTSKGTTVDDDDPSPQFARSKRMLQETRQLLFDCVEEIVESHAINSNGSDYEKVKKCHRGLVGPEELGSLILERMKAWDSHIGNESNTVSSSSLEDWKTAFDFEKREVCSEIGDSIVEAIVNEIVVQMLN